MPEGKLIQLILFWLTPQVEKAQPRVNKKTALLSQVPCGLSKTSSSSQTGLGVWRCQQDTLNPFGMGDADFHGHPCLYPLIGPLPRTLTCLGRINSQLPRTTQRGHTALRIGVYADLYYCDKLAQDGNVTPTRIFLLIWLKNWTKDQTAADFLDNWSSYFHVLKTCMINTLTL